MNKYDISLGKEEENILNENCRPKVEEINININMKRGGKLIQKEEKTIGEEVEEIVMKEEEEKKSLNTSELSSFHRTSFDSITNNSTHGSVDAYAVKVTDNLTGSITKKIKNSSESDRTFQRIEEKEKEARQEEEEAIQEEEEEEDKKSLNKSKSSLFHRASFDSITNSSMYGSICGNNSDSSNSARRNSNSSSVSDQYSTTRSTVKATDNLTGSITKKIKNGSESDRTFQRIEEKEKEARQEEEEAIQEEEEEEDKKSLNKSKSSLFHRASFDSITNSSMYGSICGNNSDSSNSARRNSNSSSVSDQYSTTRSTVKATDNLTGSITKKIKNGSESIVKDAKENKLTDAYNQKSILFTDLNSPNFTNSFTRLSSIDHDENEVSILNPNSSSFHADSLQVSTKESNNKVLNFMTVQESNNESKNDRVSTSRDRNSSSIFTFGSNQISPSQSPIRQKEYNSPSHFGSQEPSQNESPPICFHDMYYCNLAEKLEEEEKEKGEVQDQQNIEQYNERMSCRKRKSDEIGVDESLIRERREEQSQYTFPFNGNTNISHSKASDFSALHNESYHQPAEVSRHVEIYEHGTHSFVKGPAKEVDENRDKMIHDTITEFSNFEKTTAMPKSFNPGDDSLDNMVYDTSREKDQNDETNYQVGDLYEEMESIFHEYEDECRFYSIRILNNFLCENPNDPHFTLEHMKLEVKNNQQILRDLQNKEEEERKRLEKLKQWIKSKQEEMNQGLHLLFNT